MNEEHRTKLHYYNLRMFSFLLLNRIYHMDLYRLSGKPEDLLPLNMDYVFANCKILHSLPKKNCVSLEDIHNCQRLNKILFLLSLGRHIFDRMAREDGRQT